MGSSSDLASPVSIEAYVTEHQEGGAVQQMFSLDTAVTKVSSDPGGAWGPRNRGPPAPAKLLFYRPNLLDGLLISAKASL